MNIREMVDRISYFRNKANLSARELSLRIGKSDAYINKLESKDFTLSMQVFFEILAVLEISAAEFFADDYANYKQNKEIFDLLANLSPERKKSFIDLMKNTK